MSNKKVFFGVVFVVCVVLFVNNKKPEPVIESEMREQQSDGTYKEVTELKQGSPKVAAYQTEVENTLKKLAVENLNVAVDDVNVIANFNEETDQLSVGMIVNANIENAKEQIKKLVEHEIIPAYPKLAKDRITVTNGKNEFLY